MDLELSEEQDLLRATTRRFLETECPLAEVRRLEHHPPGFETEFWRRGAELGWTALLVGAEHGGSGGELADLAVVVEEMGRLVSPGPLVPVNVVAAAVAAEGTPGQRAAVLPGLVAGQTVAAWACAEPRARWSPDGVACLAVPVPGGYVVSGVKAPVEAAAEADHLLVTARTAAGPTQFLIDARTPGVSIAPMAGLDLVRRFAEVRLDAVRVPAELVLGAPGGAGPAAERQLQIAAALQCAESSGAAARVLEFTLEYVGQRYSFGRPLSSYQALKHRLADLKLWSEACHATTTAAIRAVDQRSPDAAELVSAAKAYVGTRSTELIQDCIQLHGGIGVTWAHDLHVYLRRATVNRVMYGSPAEHRERIAVLLGMGPVSA